MNDQVDRPSRMRSRAHPEAQLQRAVVAYLRLALPADAVMTAIGHGGGGRVRGAILKGMGLTPGWPDLQFLWRSKFYSIELKSPKGLLGPKQYKVSLAIEHAGGFYGVVRQIDDAQKLLAEWGIPTRAKVTCDRRHPDRARV